MPRLISLLLLLAMPNWWLLAADLIPLSAQQQKNLGIVTQSLSKTGGAQSGWPARVELPPANLRMVVAPVSGMVVRLNKSAGEAVRAGEALASLSSTELLAGQRDLMSAETRLKLARDNAARDEKLFAEGIIAESRLRHVRAELAQAQTEYNAQRATLRAYGVGDRGLASMGAGGLSTQLGVSSPISGVVLESFAEVGSRLEAGAPVYKVADLSRLALVIDLSAAQSNSVAPGQMVSVAGSQASGRITAIGAQVGGAQTVMVRAEIRDPQNRLRPGQNVEARLQGEMKGQVWVIPAQAIAWQSARAHVFAATPQGFRAVPVAVQSQTPQGAVVSGLKGDERIAVSGLAALKSLWQSGGK